MEIIQGGIKLKISLYHEMTEKIVGLLRLVDDNPTMLYAAALIESLQEENANLKVIVSPVELAKIAMVQIEFKQLQSDNSELQKALELARKECNAATTDLRDNAHNSCYVCKSWINGRCTRTPKDCAGFWGWKWRGIQQTKEAISGNDK
jgi:hypothetical protein